MYKLIIFLLFLTSGLCAQEYSDSVVVVPHPDILTVLQQKNETGGEVILQSTPAVDHLLQLHIRQHEKQKSFSGYRIQIYSGSSYGSDVEKLKEMRDRFETQFPDIPAYLKYIDPDFKIRVGNFHTRLECIPALYRIRKFYPSSYPVKTEISLDELTRIPMQDIPKAEETEQLPDPEEE